MKNKDSSDHEWSFVIPAVFFFASLCYSFFKDVKWEWEAKYLILVIPYALVVGAFAFIASLFGVGASSFWEMVTKKFKASSISEKTKGAFSLLFVGALLVFWIMYCIHGHLFGHSGINEPDVTERYDNRLP